MSAGRGRREKVRRETKDGWVVTSAVRKNEWGWYEGLEEVEWERFHVKMFDLETISGYFMLA